MDEISPEEQFKRSVGSQERRKLRVRRQRSALWSGFGMLGIVGWSIGMPTLLGALLGTWLDRHHPMAGSWTITLLFAGLVLGCFNAWRWLAREQLAIHREEDE